ncbi:MAG: hypothetical protein D6775_09225 [Caldilineae bacterium]|nr:MAG: hypothetical protein D6775_09225 [Caldilineae bacterium]
MNRYSGLSAIDTAVIVAHADLDRIGPLGGIGMGSGNGAGSSSRGFAEGGRVRDGSVAPVDGSGMGVEHAGIGEGGQNIDVVAFIACLIRAWVYRRRHVVDRSLQGIAGLPADGTGHADLHRVHTVVGIHMAAGDGARVATLSNAARFDG